ncbi:HAUS3 protein, partial [Trogon melanurus]|nr:HAUS3 protein [Trogon melanurus]
VNRGAQFLATLRLFYPHTDTLCEKDFDWLFDCPQTKQFLEWFCSTVSEENVLHPTEVEAYEALLAAGKPILEGDALEQALQVCCQVLQLPNTMLDDEGPSLEALQQELQELKDYHDRQLWRHSKLQVWTANLQQQLRYLKEGEKAVKQDLKKAQMDLEDEIFQTSAILSEISTAAKQLAEWHEDMEKGQPAAPLCEMDLGPYMVLEQQATEEFERFSQQVLPESVLAPDTRGANGIWEATERMDVKQTTMPRSFRTDGDELLEDQDSYWKELSRLEKAHICAQRELIVISATVEGNCAVLECAQKTLEALEKNQQVVKAELQRQAATFQTQLRALRCDIMQTLTYQLPPLLKANTHQFCLPVLQKQFSLEAARLQRITKRHKEMAAWLVNQHSRLDLLELHLKRKIKEVDQKAAQLEKMKIAMREAQTRLQEQQDHFKDISSLQKCCPRIWIDPKDFSAVRLWDMLMGQGGEEQLFRSYETIAAQCSQLVQDQKRMLEAQLVAPMPQLLALESSTKVLYWLLYNSSNELQLSSPEITELMEQLITMQDNLYQILSDFLRDLKAKRGLLESPILQTERNLYVYFYCDEDRLREVVEKLEKHVSASSR